jgi:16S rRNA (uracil1498-N3)-methyltransferase
MPDRFYAPTSFENGTVRLTGPEAHHLRDVMRLRIGQQVVLFDGEGGEADAEIVSFGKEFTDLRLGAVRHDEPTGRPSIVLATAVPKGERFRWLIEKAVELGVDRLVALNTSRSVVDPRETKLEKMRSIVIAACKQSGRNTLMPIEGTISWNPFVQSTRDNHSRLLVADPSGAPIVDVFATRQEAAGSSEEIVLAVGSEGGFLESELTMATEAGGELVSLGNHILRMETAALAMAAYVQLAAARSAEPS